MNIMEKIGLVADEAADLPQEIIEKNQIAIVPVKLDWPGIKDLSGENTFQKMRELERREIKSFGKTSQPSPKDFLDNYNYQLERFDKILCIVLTSKLSGTYNSAIQAKNFLQPKQQGRVFIIDSLNASAGENLLVLRAIDLIKEGKRVEEIVEDLENFIPRIRFFVMFEDPKWIEASGRISSLVANLLRRMAKIGIRPLLSFKNGVLVPVGIKTGSKYIPAAIFKQFEKEVQKSKKKEKEIKVVITHGDDAEGAQRLKEMIENRFKNAKVIFINIIDNVVGSISGPNTISCAWYEK